jgi:glucokinase
MANSSQTSAELEASHHRGKFENRPPTCAIGIDVGGTKCAAGLISWPAGRVMSRRLQPTQAARGGDAVLLDVIQMARSLQQEAIDLGVHLAAIGIGVAELVDRQGNILSQSTIRWQHLPVTEQVRAATTLPTITEADVRAAARAEAWLGAGRTVDPSLYVTVGTGISACLIMNGVPYEGSGGLTGTFASSPTLVLDGRGELLQGLALEQYASGPGLAARFAQNQDGFSGTAKDVIELAESGDANAGKVVANAARALGAAVGHLVNIWDPVAVIMGGGLGLAKGLYRHWLTESLRVHIWSEHHRDIPVLDAQLGVDAGWIGAAIKAWSAHR